MSDEVKQAAERVRRMQAGESCIAVYAPPGTTENRANASYTLGTQLEDDAILAAAYVRDHANDDENATLLTAEILQASGWVPWD